MKKMPPYHERLQKLQAQLKELGCDALLIDDEVNLFYLTGLELSAGKLLVHLQGAHVIVDSRYYELCRKNSPFPVLLADQTSFLKTLHAPEFAFIKTLAFDADHATYNNYRELQKIAEGRFALLPADNPVKILRGIKDAGEIEILREAAALGSEGFDYVLTLLEEGITESKIAVELELFWKKRGSKGVAFDPIIAFGANGSMPHYRAGDAKLKPGQSVLIDIGVNYRHYHSDMTRVVFFGKPDPKILEIYQIVQKAQALALELCRPGTTIGQLDDAARKYIAEKGYGDRFTHSLGHGVGLEIHEYPTLRNKPPLSAVPLQAGMVVTIEPGIYLPDIGGVRIEDTVVITPEGYENLTKRPTDVVVK